MKSIQLITKKCETFYNHLEQFYQNIGSKDAEITYDP